ncbi:MAG TPA: hypothetical protein VK610_00655, partial [Rhodothermales bacterium]|nr:hypothetical protein [Rhodothermales bacterium]
MSRLLPLALLLLAVGTLAACDSGIGGSANGNRAPETELSVRVTDLRVTLDGTTLPSTVAVAWVGTDPDGVVAAYDFRYYDASRLGTIGPEEGWVTTTRRDTSIVLPIPEGSATAAVVFEVRAVDDDGSKDATPARTVFPIRNSAPSLRLLAAEAPPDSTWPVISFGWAATDPDGEANLASIELALNDTTGGFARLPGDIDFVTLVALEPGATESETRLLLGRNGIPSDLRLPGLRIGAANTLYIRAVDAAGARSVTRSYPEDETGTFFVRRVTSPVLLVNDYRTERHGIVMAYHRPIVREYLGGVSPDEWFLSTPYQTGANTELRYAANFPPQSTPTLRETFKLWRAIYWVSSNATNRAQGNNLPLAASVIDPFFDAGGRMFVNVAARPPASSADNIGNAALSLLPLSGLLSFGPGNAYPDFEPLLDLFINAPIAPVDALPTGQPLPALRARRFIAGTFSYPVESGTLSLYRASYTATRSSTGNTEPWTGPSTIASMRGDGRVALFALPLVSDINGQALLEGADGNAAAP